MCQMHTNILIIHESWIFAHETQPWINLTQRYFDSFASTVYLQSKLSPVLLWVCDKTMARFPNRSREVGTIVGDQAAEYNSGAWLEIFLQHWMALIIHSGQRGDYHNQMNHQCCRRMTVDLNTKQWEYTHTQYLLTTHPSPPLGACPIDSDMIIYPF